MVQSNINFIVEIAEAYPGQHTIAGFKALTYTPINGVITAPSFGTTHTVNYVADLALGQELPFKGAAKGNETTMSCYDVSGDSGQDKLRTQAAHQNGHVSLKLTKLSAPGAAVAVGDEIRFAKGVLHSFTPTEVSANTEQGFTVSFNQQDLDFKTTHTA